MDNTSLTSLVWWKSSYSNGSGGECVEVAVPGATPGGAPEGQGGAGAGLARVRDSKDPDGPVLSFGLQTWTAFLTGLRTERWG